jgi:hypothetical protein
MKHIILLIFLLSATYSTLKSQTVIKMKREGGISLIPCRVNGLNLDFIFDTGASDVSISMTEATFMLKNGYLNRADITGTNNYFDATGNLNEGIIILLKEIEIAGLKLYNVKASIVKNNRAPLLLGQTAISKLGKIQLDLAQNTLTILTGKGSYDFSNKIDEEKPTPVKSYEKYDPIIGNSIMIGNLEIAQNDFNTTLTWYNAKEKCQQLGNGWRLPTIDELEILYNNKDRIGGFGTGYYYSSTLRANHNSLLLPVTILFGDGFKSLSENYHQTAFHVRAVRLTRN